MFRCHTNSNSKITSFIFALKTWVLESYVHVDDNGIGDSGCANPVIASPFILHSYNMG
jgi:hypothetical protein